MMKLRKPQRLSAYRRGLIGTKQRAARLRGQGFTYAQIGQQLGAESKTGRFARSTVAGWLA